MKSQLIITLVSTAALAGCGKKDKDKAAPEPTPAPSPSGSSAPAGSQTAPEGSAAPEGSGSATPSGSGAAAGSAAKLDLCSWVTVEEVQKALGIEITKAESDNLLMPDQLGGCSWRFGKPALHVAFVKAWEVDSYGGMVRGVKNNGGEVEPVSGIGQEAVVSKRSPLFVKIAGKPYFLAFQVNDGRQDPNRERAEALAKLVIPAAK